MALKVTVLAMAVLHCGSAVGQLQTKYKWKVPEFAFPSEAVKQSMIDNGSYIPDNGFILDVDAWYRGPEHKLFVTTPRLMPGIPATLSVLCGKNRYSNKATSPLLKPYPSLSWNRQGNCNGITNVFRVQVDPCGRLWVLDSGVVNVFTNPQRICQPQVLVFDLRSDRLISRYRIPEENLNNDSLLITIAVDVRQPGYSCRNAFAYIADVVGYALIVYDATRGRSWRITNSLFEPYPEALSFTISGVTFIYSDGLFGLALSPPRGGDRALYFHSLSSFRESRVKTSVLRNESLYQNDSNAAGDQFQQSAGTRSSQTAATAMNKNAVLISNQVSNNSINCWNSRLNYTSENIVELARNDEILQFASGLKVVQDRYGKEMVLALSCPFQDLVTGIFNTSKINFRVVTASLQKLVKGTSCDVGGN